MTTPFTKLEHGLGRVLVLGLGISGLSVVRYLADRGGIAAVADGRETPAGLEVVQERAPNAQLFLGNLEDIDCADFDTVVLSPGYPRRSELVLKALELGLEVIGDIELFARHVKGGKAKVVSVSGSNGKSTVVHLLTEMAKKNGLNVALGGNYGIPALDTLSPEVQLYVLELSSFQLESTASLKSVAATVLNISPDHMDRYESIAEYAHYKARVYQQAGTQVVNRDDPLARELTVKGKQRSFGLGAPLGSEDYGVRKLHGSRHLVKGDQALLDVKVLKLLGTHNQANSLAALALGEAAGLAQEAMLETLRGYTGLPHRTQWVARINGVTWVNDSKATNTGATIAALEGMPGPVILIAGGQAKGAKFNDLAGVVDEYCRHVVLLGEDAQKIADSLEEGVSVSLVETMQDAVDQAHAIAESGDVVLLSPACASFDMYQGYAQRGEDFVTRVLAVTALDASEGRDNEVVDGGVQ